jgi:hypothetical protein
VCTILGLRYYEELLQRMPRAEATLLVSTVQAAVEKLAPGGSALHLFVIQNSVMNHVASVSALIAVYVLPEHHAYLCCSSRVDNASGTVCDILVEL